MAGGCSYAPYLLTYTILTSVGWYDFKKKIIGCDFFGKGFKILAPDWRLPLSHQ
jgi:hypothetical protein